jgi:hypothetical protein
VSTDDTHRIRERAYEIWISEGRPEGRHLDHWHRAEWELQTEGANAGHDEAGLAAAREYDSDVKEFDHNGQVERSAREAEDALAGPEAKELKKAEAVGKSRSKAKNASGNI